MPPYLFGCGSAALWGRLFVWGRLSSLRPAFEPTWAPFTHRPLHTPMERYVGAAQRVRPLRGACRQACHAGGHAGRATQSRAVREFQRHPARAAARSTSTRRPFSSYLCVLRALCGLLFPCPPCPPWFVFSVFSVSSVLLARRFFSAREDFLCRHTCLVAALPRCGLPSPCPPCRVRCGAGFLACGRLSSRPRPPLPSASLATDRACGPCSTPLCLPHRHFLWSKPPGLPCRPLRGASRQACHAGGHAGRATQSRAARASPRHPARTSARSTSTRALLFLSPCSLCPLYY